MLILNKMLPRILTLTLAYKLDNSTKENILSQETDMWNMNNLSLPIQSFLFVFVV